MRYLLLLFILFVSGCNQSTDIKNPILNDRVKACGAGFSESTQSSLNATLNKASLQGGINGDIKNESLAAIISEMPDSIKLKAYEDYIKCIEKNWNR